MEQRQRIRKESREKGTGRRREGDLRRGRGGRGERMTKQCELCELPARMFCEADQASLCWECDAKVHGANFLVARHCRHLLCRSCQAPTPWRASGSRLGSTVSVCNRCLGDNSAEASDTEGHERGGGVERERRGGLVEGDAEGRGNIGEEQEMDGEDEEDDDEEDDFENEEEEEEEDGDNQVVPWSTGADEAGAASPPPLASCSSSDESSSERAGAYSGFLKRRREDDDLPSSHWQEDTGCSPSQHDYLRFSAGVVPFPGRMLEEEEDGEEDAPYSGCSFPQMEDRIREVRPRPETAGPSAPPPPRLWRDLSDR